MATWELLYDMLDANGSDQVKFTCLDSASSGVSLVRSAGCPRNNQDNSTANGFSGPKDKLQLVGTLPKVLDVDSRVSISSSDYAV